jgi:5-methylcytosine-specific restriction endonuclease McrA
MEASPDGHKPRCKQCRNNAGREYYSHNSDKVKKTHKEYYEGNKGLFREKSARFERLNPGNSSERSKKHYLNNRSEVLIRNRETLKKRYHSDSVYKLRLLISGKLRSALTGRSLYSERSQMYQIVGISASDLVIYLWGTFESTYGLARNDISLDSVEIDHIVPKSKGKTEEEVKKLNHYTNLQLLFKEDNQKKHAKYCKGDLK